MNVGALGAPADKCLRPVAQKTLRQSQCLRSIGALQDKARNKAAWEQVVQVLAAGLPAFPSVDWMCHFPVVPQWASSPHPSERFADTSFSGQRFERGKSSYKTITHKSSNEYGALSYLNKKTPQSKKRNNIRYDERETCSLMNLYRPIGIA